MVILETVVSQAILEPIQATQATAEMAMQVVMESQQVAGVLEE
jgi:hypothetical protein